MPNQTITLQSELVDHLEIQAESQRQSLNEVVADLTNSSFPLASGNWALVVAEGIESTEVNWIVDPAASLNNHD